MGQLVKNKNKLSANWNIKLLKVVYNFILLTLFSYVAFAIDDRVIERHGSNNIWISIIPFNFLFMRYLYISLMANILGDPTEAIFKR